MTNYQLKPLPLQMVNAPWATSMIIIIIIIIPGVVSGSWWRMWKDVGHRMNEGYRAWRALKSVRSNRGKGQEVSIWRSNCTNDIVRSRGMGIRNAERRKANVLEMKCLRSLVGVSRMDKVRMRAGIERELASRAEQRVHIEMVWACGKNGWVLYGQKGVDSGSQWTASTR